MFEAICVLIEAIGDIEMLEALKAAIDARIARLEKGKRS